jgi:hypothetical protein
MRKVIFFNFEESEESNDIKQKLAGLTEGDEVNVHLGEKIHYEAAFKSYNSADETAAFIIDRFYENGGELVSFKLNEITGLELPLSEETVEGEDE